MHESLLAWKNYRYLKWFVVLFVISVAVFVSQFSNAAPVSGGTWQGYMLGTVGALLIVLLAFLGIRNAPLSFAVRGAWKDGRRRTFIWGF